MGYWKELNEYLKELHEILKDRENLEYMLSVEIVTIGFLSFALFLTILSKPLALVCYFFTCIFSLPYGMYILGKYDC